MYIIALCLVHGHFTKTIFCMKTVNKKLEECVTLHSNLSRYLKHVIIIKGSYIFMRLWGHKCMLMCDAIKQKESNSKKIKSSFQLNCMPHSESYICVKLPSKLNFNLRFQSYSLFYGCSKQCTENWIILFTTSKQ